MRSTRLALLISILLAGPVLAQQENPGVGLPRPKPDEREKVRFVDPEGKPGQQQPAEPKPKPGEEKPAVPDGLDALLLALEAWPASSAQVAIDALVADAEASRPRLLQVLAGKNRNARCGAAMALSRIGNKEDVSAILAASRDRRLTSRVVDLLKAAETLDADAARTGALAILERAPRPAQARAAQFLETRLRDEDRARVEALLSSKSSGARTMGLDLLAKRYGAEVARPLALAALGDRTPEVARTASRYLAGDEGAGEALIEKARPFDSRPAAYATLTLSIRAQTLGTQPFDDEMVSAMIGGRGIRSVDPLFRGIAAIVLGQVAYLEQRPEVDVLLEPAVLPALLDNLGGPRFFPDQPGLKPPSLQLLETLTAQTYGLDVRAWRTWWDANRETYRVRRRLREVTNEDLASLTIEIGIPGRPTIHLSTNPDQLGEGALVVGPEILRGLLEILVEEDFFKDRWSSKPNPGDVQITIRAERRERTGALPMTQLVDVAARLQEQVEAIRARNVWQHYWDRDDFPGAAEFVRARRGLFGPDVSPEDRDAHLRIVIVEALDDLSPDDRLTAIRLLGKLEGPVLEDRLASAIMREAEAEKGVTPFAEAAIRFLVSEEATVVRDRLLDFLSAQPGERAQALLADALAGLGEEAVRGAIADQRPTVRRAAVRAMGETGGKGAVERLTAHLDDVDMGVRLETLASLGKLKARDALPAIESAAGEESPPKLRAAALRALGAAGGAEAIPTLMNALRSPSVAVRVAAIQGLAATEDREAVSPLLFAMERDPYAGVVAVASRAIVDLGGDKAKKGLRRLAADPEMKLSVRQAAVQSLGRLDDLDALVSLLEDDTLGVDAALALAGRRDARAAPKLLAALASGRSRRVLTALEGLAARTFGVRGAEETATLFLGWWEVHREGTPTDWLISALRDRGYDIRKLREGEEREALGVLIRALDDESWAVRHSASRELMSRTGEDFGRVEKFTSREDAQRIADLWRRWWDND